MEYRNKANRGPDTGLLKVEEVDRLLQGWSPKEEAKPVAPSVTLGLTPTSPLARVLGYQATKTPAPSPGTPVVFKPMVLPATTPIHAAPVATRSRSSAVSQTPHAAPPAPALEQLAALAPEVVAPQAAITAHVAPEPAAPKPPAPETVAAPEQSAAAPAAAPSPSSVFLSDPRLQWGAPDGLVANDDWEPQPRAAMRPAGVIAVAVLSSLATAGVMALVMRPSAAAPGELETPTSASRPPAPSAPVAPAPVPSKTAAPQAARAKPAPAPAQATAGPEDEEEDEEEDDEPSEDDDGSDDEETDDDAEDTEAPAAATEDDDDPLAGIAERLTTEDVVAGVRQNGSSISPCVLDAINDGELERGESYTLVLDWTVNPDGSVARPRMKGPADLMETSLPDCVAGKMRRWRFKSSSEAVPVSNFPFGPITVR